ncbi:nucleotide pyrophosphohydrolase [Bifidobacterium vespertilionis]|uniref:Nucleotide pyrophosphohydrolase n=2 Tax=Bifidobacterium vespertilionis TaxID=2562524 RepID=A0A5J5E5Z9_9BIFI|nr:nucleotide pyrophosphohydrolase [Bifidobacterium vespertilionis]KAA8824573.1 nucleotide pyrophosphohydrolase [Bifidobacterium vespertilionis]
MVDAVQWKGDVMTEETEGNMNRGYRLPEGFEQCSKLDPVLNAPTALDRVRAVVDILYSPGGCPWDGKQTNRSLLKNLLEETYEYVDAVETGDRANMREELGDVLLQSVFQARVCESDPDDPFDIGEVADRLVDKLITRHPHVFASDREARAEADEEESPEAVLALWERMKQREKHRQSVLDGISHAQGALPRAAKVASRIAKSPNAERLFAVFDSIHGSESKGGEHTPDAYADQILDIIRCAQADGVDIEAALRNRLRTAEAAVAACERTIKTGETA